MEHVEAERREKEKWEALLSREHTLPCGAVVQIKDTTAYEDETGECVTNTVILQVLTKPENVSSTLPMEMALLVEQTLYHPRKNDYSYSPTGLWFRQRADNAVVIDDVYDLWAVTSRSRLDC